MFATLVTYPTTIHPTPYATHAGVTYYTRPDYLTHYAAAHGMTDASEVLAFESTYGVDVRDLELKRTHSEAAYAAGPSLPYPLGMD